MSVEDTSLKALGYGVERDRFFADDVNLVEHRIAAAVKRAREESMPTVIEVRTYRFRGHSMSDPAKYRTASEVEEQKRRDPLLLARRELVEATSEDRAKGLEAEVETEVQEAVKFAEESPEPDMSVLEPTTYDGPFAA
jgi:pyruvate dehydrogenase E1 component alpha subunit